MNIHFVQDNPDEEDDEGETASDREATHKGPRTSFGIYEKLLAIREADRLIEEGFTKSVEKTVMQTFPGLFRNRQGGLKSGMLGRWMIECKRQRWREIPFEKLSAKDRKMKQLPDWIRIPLGMPPRALERFKEGKNVPQCVIESLISICERLSCGTTSDRAALTSGILDGPMLKREAEKLLEAYNAKVKVAAEAAGKTPPKVKTQLSEKWTGRFLEAYGWTKRAPNTAGAYLEYSDERMDKSRKLFAFMRLSNDVRLDMALNFDQVWKQSWADPQKLLCRQSDVMNPCDLMVGKRRQAIEALTALQRRANGEDLGQEQWQAKKRRITGRWFGKS